MSRSADGRRRGRIAASDAAPRRSAGAGGLANAARLPPYTAAGDKLTIEGDTDMLMLRDIMTSDVATLHPDDTLRDAITMLNERSITGAPVVAGSAVVGVISMVDIMDLAANVRHLVTGSPEGGAWEERDREGVEASSSWYADPWDDGASPVEETDELRDVLEEHTVDEAMTRKVLMLASDSEIHAAAAFMIEHGVHRILVVDDGQLEGLVTTTDFLRLIAERRI
jgi:CBS domain-containing protein